MTEPSSRRARAAGEKGPEVLRAGPLLALLCGVDLRRIALGADELISRIYVASRGPDWSTADSRLRRLRIEERDRGVDVRFAVDHVGPEIGVAWKGAIHLDARSMRYEVSGVTTRPTRYLRLGLCVLHPPSMAGATYMAQTPRGPVRGTFPHAINPQFLPPRGEDHTTLPAFTELAIERSDGLRMRLRFTGEVFEIEDQRNWGDASFKTYSPPLADSREQVAPANKRVRQGVEIEIGRPPRLVRRPAARSVAIGAGDGGGEPRPKIGIGDDPALAALIRPDHVRVELRTMSGLHAAVAAAGALGSALELDMRPARLRRRDFATLARAIAGADVARLIVEADEATTTAARLALPHIPVAGGSGESFAGLNSRRPDFWLLDEIVWPMHPQTHAGDDMSVMETPAILADMLATARLFAGDRPLGIAPLTLAAPGVDDERVTRPFGAAWTLATLAYASLGGAASVTCPDGGAGAHVLADFCERPWRVCEAPSDDPRRVVAVELRSEPVRCVVAANLTSDRVTVTGRWLRGARARRLHADTLERAMADPRGFRKGSSVTVSARLVLEPHETIRLDY